VLESEQSDQSRDRTPSGSRNKSRSKAKNARSESKDRTKKRNCSTGRTDKSKTRERTRSTGSRKSKGRGEEIDSDTEEDRHEVKKMSSRKTRNKNVESDDERYRKKQERRKKNSEDDEDEDRRSRDDQKKKRDDSDSSPEDKHRDAKSKKGGGHKKKTSEDEDFTAKSKKKKRPHKILMPEKFTGQGSVETFLAHFETCSVHNGWSEEEKGTYLKWSLSGEAGLMLWDLGGEDSKSFKKLVQRVRTRYGGKGQEARFQAELRALRRSKGQTLQSLAQEVRRLMALAYPGVMNTMTDQFAKDAFLNALDDRTLELELRKKDVVGLDAACIEAVKLESIEKASNHGSSPQPERRRGVNRQVKESYYNNRSPEKYSRELIRKVDQLATDVAKMTNLVDPPKNNQSINEERPQARRTEQVFESSGPPLTSRVQPRGVPSHPGSTVDGGLWCSNCGQHGHLERNCLKQGTSNRSETVNREQVPDVRPWCYYCREHGHIVPECPRRGQRRTQEAVPDVRCYNCQGLGHFSRQCKQPRPQRSPTSGTSRPHCTLCGQDGHWRDKCSVGVELSKTTSSETRELVRGTSDVDKSGHTYLRMKILDREVECLLDSGSTVTLLPADVVYGVEMRPSSRGFVAANGTDIGVLGKASVMGVINNLALRITGYVSENVSEVMLGADWLKKYKAIWDFNKGMVKLDGRRFTLRKRTESNSDADRGVQDGVVLYKRPRIEKVRRVVLQEDVVVPARSQVDVPTKVIYSDFRHPTTDEEGTWSTTPSEVESGVQVARTLVPLRSFNVPVRVMNVLEHPVKMKKDEVVSNLEVVKVQGENGDAKAEVREDYSCLDALVEEVDEDVPDEDVFDLKKLLHEYADVFSRGEYDVGDTTVVMHRIDVGGNRPVKQWLRRHPLPHHEAIKEQTDAMLRQGIIEPTQGEWRSNVVLVKKKDGTLRFCVDYRKLNDLTKKDVYPLPRIDDCLDALSGSTWFSTFDLRAGYHQVRVAEEDRDKTSFATREGTFQFRKMPFGLSCAGATFQRLMDIVLSGLNHECCLVYLDDIILYSTSVRQHLDRLRLLFERLRRANLKLKPSKCSLLKKEVGFLGHVVSGDGISTDKTKTEAVSEWPIPVSTREVRRFVGLCSYYRKFVPDFASKAAPLHALMSANVRFKWSPECHKSFETLKKALTESPVLTLPSDTGAYVLDTDACDHGIGAVLSLGVDGVEKPVAYASRTYGKSEKNYCVTRKELLAVVHFVKYFKQYLLGRHFRVRTDHAALQWLRRTPEPIGQQARWLEQLEEFDFEVIHRIGARHGNADALSRRPCRGRGCCELGAAKENRIFAVSQRPTVYKFEDEADGVEENFGGEECEDYTSEPRQAGKPAGVYSSSVVAECEDCTSGVRHTQEPAAVCSASAAVYSARREECCEYCTSGGSHAPEPTVVYSTSADENNSKCTSLKDGSSASAAVYLASTFSGVKFDEVNDEGDEQPGRFFEDEEWQDIEFEFGEVEVYSSKERAQVRSVDPLTTENRNCDKLVWTWEAIAVAQKTDDELKKIIELLEQYGDKPTWKDVGYEGWKTKAYWQQWSRLAIRDGLLKRRWETVDGLQIRWQVIYPKTYRKELILRNHSGMTGGHLGVNKTCMRLQPKAYWLNWSDDVKATIAECAPCAQYYRGQPKKKTAMQEMPVGETWERVAIDVTGKHPRSSRGNEYIITVIDHFTKFAEAFPVPNHQAVTVARVLCEQLFSRYGPPIQLLSDNGPEFKSRLIEEVCKWMGIDKINSSPYRPQTNGQIERFHRTLNSMLGKVVQENQRDWDQKVPVVMAAYRATMHESTGYTPNFLFFGRENFAPLDVLMGIPDSEKEEWQSYEQYVAERQEAAHRAYECVRDHLKRSATRRKKYYDLRVRPSGVRPNTWVWYHYPRRFVGRTPKWQRMFTGPFLCVRRIEPSDAVIQRSRRSQPFVVHLDKLKPALGETPRSWLSNEEEVENGSHISSEPSQKIFKEVGVQVDLAEVRDESSDGPSPPIQPHPFPIQNTPDPSCVNAETNESIEGRLKRKITKPRYLREYVCAVGENILSGKGGVKAQDPHSVKATGDEVKSKIVKDVPKSAKSKKVAPANIDI
jgi:transposase InsO family protein